MHRLALSTKFGRFDLQSVNSDGCLVWVARRSIEIPHGWAVLHADAACVEMTLNDAGEWWVTFANCEMEDVSLERELRVAARIGRGVLRAFERACEKKPQLGARCRAAVETSRVSAMIHELAEKRDEIRRHQATLAQAEDEAGALELRITAAMSHDPATLSALLHSEDADVRMVAIQFGVSSATSITRKEAQPSTRL